MSNMPRNNLMGFIWQTEEAKSQIQDPWVQGEWFIHCTMAAPAARLEAYVIFSLKTTAVDAQIFKSEDRAFCKLLKLFILYA